MAGPILPTLLAQTNPPPDLVALGAEAYVYHTHFLTASHPCILKYRPSKPYRHPTLDARLTRHRILSEARTLVKCMREGVNVPGVLALDADAGWLMEEWIEGGTVRERLQSWRDRRKEVSLELQGSAGIGSKEEEMCSERILNLMRRIGDVVGRLHEVGVVHGDLTTSNLMLQSESNSMTNRHTVAGNSESHGAEVSLAGEVVLIDFGLASTSVQDEDKAVDLYVLERAFGSTHPEVEEQFKEVLKAYGESYKGGKLVLKRLEEVRMRGRKKSMLG
ncbi:MAG: hypothetical protein Q9183_003324 [Haloplaca sp. 2 TL-2023]